ncbi:MAG: transport system ATP-binding/permease protein [Nocardioidaceae bacterium]|nr:transport system ATP-binding/permease protein [Nocardioidaceae bacterium]
MISLDVGGRTYRFSPDDAPVLIGRGAVDGVDVGDRLVSRRHALLEYRDRWTVTDLGSTNGTWRNGHRVASSIVVSDEVIIRLGDGSVGPSVRLATRDVDRSAAAVACAPKPTATPPARVIGRNPSAWLHVSDPMASWEHAELRREADAWWLTDRGSTNQTLVNGGAVTRHRLRDNDLVLVGNTQLRWRDDTLHQVEAADFVVDRASLTIRGGRRIVDNVSFSVPQSSLVAVIGPSGAGKSSLLRLVTGKLKPSSGTVSLHGANMTSQRRAHRGQIGVVPQHTVAHGPLTARQVLDHTARLRFAADVDKDERDQRVLQILERLGLRDHAGTRISRLSGGQQRRVAIAMELLTDPSLLILDEPTAGLDPSLVLQIMQVLRELADGGKQVLVVTHDLDYLKLVDRVLVLRAGGTTAYDGPPDGVFTHFGTDNWPDTFELLSVPSADEKRPGLARPDADATRLKPFDLPIRPTHLGTVLRHVGVITRRQLRLIATDPLYLALLVGMPLALGVLAVAVPGSDGFGAAREPQSVEATRLLVLVIVGAAFLGLSSTVRDLVGERLIYLHEREAGLVPAGYLAAKTLVFTLVATAQSTLLVGLVALQRGGLHDPLILPSATLELTAAVSVTAATGVALGLAVSAKIRTSEQAMPPLVLLVMAQLVLCGGMFPVHGRGVIAAVATAFPTRWGYAAAAATVDLNNSSPAVDGDPLWVHTADNWIGCVLVMSALWAAFIGLAAYGLYKPAASD